MLLNLVQFIIFTGLFIGLTPLLGTYMAYVFTGKASNKITPFCLLENMSYRIGGVNATKEMSWKEYGKALLIFNFLGCTLVFLIQLFQYYLPLNPQNFKGVPWQLSLNMAISFATTTNWQAYAGETTLSYFTQMVGLTSTNFLSAASGMATLLALIRGLTRKTTETIGNFWVDIVRMVVYILLPLSIIMSLFLVGQGVIQTLAPYVEVATLENSKQIIPLGPAASQIAIKQLGSNGGGFFNTNSAHPFENPTALSNMIEMLAILLIPGASVYTYGLMIGSKKHAWWLFSTMFLLWILGIVAALAFENMHHKNLNAYPILEGQETRFGINNSVCWSMSTTATSNGSINAMLSSLSPLTGGIAMFNIMLGEVIFGGVGTGLCSMLMFCLLTVFLSGLMVGRTPEYLGKKIEKKEMQWVVMAILLPSALILIGSGITIMLPQALTSLRHTGPHGLTELLYAFTSCAGNNGSAFSGLNANTPYYNLILSAVMLGGRVAIIYPSLAIAGLLAKKNTTPASIGTLSTDSSLFFLLLISVIFIMGALTFFPSLALGPIVEHLLMIQDQSF